MKNLSGSALCTALLAVLLFAGCKKQDVTEPVNETTHEANSISSNVMTTDEQFQKKHNRFDWRTLWELVQARAATAKYQNINNAIKDGYADIGVILPNMGHHYMDTSIVDGKFEVRKPEILVYNKRHDGSFQLVAVEYAVPIALTPDKAPKGFTGKADVWDRNTGFGLWLLHAWVWYFNPDGVFNPTNPLIHVHPE